MRLYVFRLDDQSKNFQGIVGIFSTTVPDVWRQRVADQHAEHVPDLVLHKEAAALKAELDALTVGTQIVGGMNLLWQMFDDPYLNLSHDHRATFVGCHEFPVLTAIPSDESLRGHVEHHYGQTAPSGRAEG